MGSNPAGCATKKASSLWGGFLRGISSATFPQCSGRAGLSAPFSPGTVDRISFLPVLSAPKIECNGYIWQHLSDSEQTGVFSVQVSTWLSTNQIPFTAAVAGFRIPLLGAKKSAKPL